jgi:biopolymer transport protein ExbD
MGPGSIDGLEAQRFLSVPQDVLCNRCKAHVHPSDLSNHRPGSDRDAMKKKSIRRTSDGPEVPITPMLDMAFQLLTFFVLTYHPAPVEGQFMMSLLPPQPATNLDATPPPDAAPSTDLPATLRTVTTVLRADETGGLGRITIGEVDVKDIDEYAQKARDVLEDPELPFDQALIQVDPRLRYEGLLKVVDVLSKYTTKIAFSLLEEDVRGVDL